MEVKKYNNKYAIKISRGERIEEALANFVKEYNPGFSQIVAIGAVKDITLGWMDDKGIYHKKHFDGDYEMLSLKGSIAGDKQIHLHAVISDKEFNSFGGHFFSAEVAVVLEVFLEVIDANYIPKKQKENDLIPVWDLEE